jgi:energy-converting hydrogenase Eha subunit E
MPTLGLSMTFLATDSASLIAFLAFITFLEPANVHHHWIVRVFVA